MSHWILCCLSLIALPNTFSCSCPTSIIAYQKSYTDFPALVASSALSSSLEYLMPSKGNLPNSLVNFNLFHLNLSCIWMCYQTEIITDLSFTLEAISFSTPVKCYSTMAYIHCLKRNETDIFGTGQSTAPSTELSAFVLHFSVLLLLPSFFFLSSPTFLIFSFFFFLLFCFAFFLFCFCISMDLFIKRSTLIFHPRVL